MKTMNFSVMTFRELNELFTLPESRWDESKPYYWHDYRLEDAKKGIADKLLKYVFEGLADSTDSEMCQRIMATLNSKEDRMALAEMLIDCDTYYDYQPDYSNLEQDAEKEEHLRDLMDDYNGIDAYVFAARLEFAQNLCGEYAEVDDLIALFAPPTKYQVICQTDLYHASGPNEDGLRCAGTTANGYRYYDCDIYQYGIRKVEEWL